MEVNGIGERVSVFVVMIFMFFIVSVGLFHGSGIHCMNDLFFISDILVCSCHCQIYDDFGFVQIVASISVMSAPSIIVMCGVKAKLSSEQSGSALVGTSMAVNISITPCLSALVDFSTFRTVSCCFFYL